MSRQPKHSAAFFVTALTLVTAALAAFLVLPSFSPTRAFAPDFSAPQDHVSQMPTTTGDCAAFQVDGVANASALLDANTRTNANTDRAIPPHLDLPGLQNFAQINPTLFRGGRPTKEGLACLAKMGVSIVISQEGKYKDLRKPVERLGMQYISMAWECSFPRDETFAKFLQLLRDNPGKKVFVYCHYGDDRTSMMVAAYRIAEQGWSAEEAKKEMKAFGFNFYHRRICTGLSEYEDHFPQHWREGKAFEKLRGTVQPQP